MSGGTGIHLKTVPLKVAAGTGNDACSVIRLSRRRIDGGQGRPSCEGIPHCRAVNISAGGGQRCPDREEGVNSLFFKGYLEHLIFWCLGQVMGTAVGLLSDTVHRSRGGHGRTAVFRHNHIIFHGITILGNRLNGDILRIFLSILREMKHKVRIPVSQLCQKPPAAAEYAQDTALCGYPKRFRITFFSCIRPVNLFRRLLRHCCLRILCRPFSHLCFRVLRQRYGCFRFRALRHLCFFSRQRQLRLLCLSALRRLLRLHGKDSHRLLYGETPACQEIRQRIDRFVFACFLRIYIGFLHPNRVKIR